MDRRARKWICLGLSAALAGGVVQPFHVYAADGWQQGADGGWYWYEGGILQGTQGRGKEIYDAGTDGWYWLDAVDGGRKAVSKDVYMESDAGVWAEGAGRTGKWVRYDADGHMVKGWDNRDGRNCYFDPVYGTMAKGYGVVEGKLYFFDKITGDARECGWEGINGWVVMDNSRYWYEEGVRQGTQGRGKEIYDVGTDAWYWLDAVDGGRKAVSKDVYMESAAGAWAERPDGTGKWVRYDADGHMVKGWDEKDGGRYYFDPVYGTMAKGEVIIEGKTYRFHEVTGKLEGEMTGTTLEPTAAPTVEPTGKPTSEPTAAPTGKPTSEPTAAPTGKPTSEPTAAPTGKPTPEPTAAPTGKPTPEPTAAPTGKPTPEPTATPTGKPTSEPTVAPTGKPTSEPTVAPTGKPTPEPTAKPTSEPTAKPTAEPTAKPTAKPTAEPTARPTAKPTAEPTARPTAEPTPEPDLTMRQQRETDHFVFYCADKDVKALDDLEDAMEGCYSRVTDDLGKTLSQKTAVYIYPDIDAFHEVSHGPDAPWSVGEGWKGSVYMVSPLNPGSEHDYESVIVVSVHEFVHIVVDQFNRYQPSYLNEGVACYEAGQLNNIYFYIPRDREQGNLPSLEEVSQREVYTYGTAYVDFVVKSFGFDTVVTLLEGNELPEATGMTMEELNEKWMDYLNSIKYLYS